jgi:CheY-like chemotaxis protein
MSYQMDFRAFTLSEAVLAVKVRRPRALVAADDPSSRRQLSDELRHLGLDVIETDDPLHALEDLVEGAEAPMPDYFDLAVADVRSDGRDGPMLVAALRRAPWTVPVVVVSEWAPRGAAHPDPASDDRATFVTPRDPEGLRTAVLDLL